MSSCRPCASFASCSPTFPHRNRFPRVVVADFKDGRRFTGVDAQFLIVDRGACACNGIIAGVGGKKKTFFFEPDRAADIRAAGDFDVLVDHRGVGLGILDFPEAVAGKPVGVVIGVFDNDVVTAGGARDERDIGIAVRRGGIDIGIAACGECAVFARADHGDRYPVRCRCFRAFEASGR